MKGDDLTWRFVVWILWRMITALVAAMSNGLLARHYGRCEWLAERVGRSSSRQRQVPWAEEEW